jgi:hypothetical protein
MLTIKVIHEVSSFTKYKSMIRNCGFFRYSRDEFFAILKQVLGVKQ